MSVVASSTGEAPPLIVAGAALIVAILASAFALGVVVDGPTHPVAEPARRPRRRRRPRPQGRRGRIAERTAVKRRSGGLAEPARRSTRRSRTSRSCPSPSSGRPPSGIGRADVQAALDGTSATWDGPRARRTRGGRDPRRRSAWTARPAIAHLILAPDAATAHRPISPTNRKRLGVLRADAVGPGVRALGWGDRTPVRRRRGEDGRRVGPDRSPAAAQRHAGVRPGARRGRSSPAATSCSTGASPRR